MAKVHVFVEVGIGAWMARIDTMLVAAPHVGDEIIVEEQVITCEHVRIGPDAVYVRETRHFQSEADAKKFFVVDHW